MPLALVLQVNGYPSSPFDTTPLVFTKPYRRMVELKDSIKTTKGDIPCDDVRTSGCLAVNPGTRLQVYDEGGDRSLRAQRSHCAID